MKSTFRKIHQCNNVIPTEIFYIKIKTNLNELSIDIKKLEEKKSYYLCFDYNIDFERLVYYLATLYLAFKYEVYVTTCLLILIF